MSDSQGPGRAPPGVHWKWWLYAWGLRLFCLLILLVLCQAIVAVGMREKIDLTTTKLHKTGVWPLTLLGDFRETYKLDVANVLAATMMLAVWFAWELLTEDIANSHSANRTRILLWTAGGLLLVCDCVLFFTGVSLAGSYGGSPIFAATVLTAMYLGLLLFLASAVCLLEGRISR